MSGPELTPQQRLASSRKAIVRHMTQSDTPEDSGTSPIESDGMEGYGDAPSGGGSWAAIRHTAKVWWQHHPAQLALNLAKPLLGRYAAEKPLQLLGISAGLGVAAVVLRPWRLISVTGLLFAAAKTSDLPVLLMSILSPAHRATDHSEETR